jgi:2-amino-4-hydroxy-6-hydroxymethyldihydropteridine diphosphokinase
MDSVQAAIALGSNLDPERNLAEGLRWLARRMRVTATSRVYRTPPWGVPDQPDFLNAAVLAETDLLPLALLDQLQAIEAWQGRVRGERWGPRTLDLDLLLYGDVVLDTPRLTLPHPRLHERRFALLPLCDLIPEARHPVLGKTLRELLEALPPERIEVVTLQLVVPGRD